MLQEVPVGHRGGGESGAQRLHPAARHHHPHESYRPDRCHALRPLRELPLQTDGEASPGQGRSVSHFNYFLKEIIDRHDPRAFVIVSPTKEVFGEGFQEGR